MYNGKITRLVLAAIIPKRGGITAAPAYADAITRPITPLITKQQPKK